MTRSVGSLCDPGRTFSLALLESQFPVQFHFLPIFDVSMFSCFVLLMLARSNLWGSLVR